MTHSSTGMAKLWPADQFNLVCLTPCTLFSSTTFLSVYSNATALADCLSLVDLPPHYKSVHKMV